MTILEKKMSVMMHSPTTSSKVVTLPKDWCTHHNINKGDKITMIADEALIMIPDSVLNRPDFDYKRFKKWLIENL